MGCLQQGPVYSCGPEGIVAYSCQKWLGSRPFPQPSHHVKFHTLITSSKNALQDSRQDAINLHGWPSRKAGDQDTEGQEECASWWSHNLFAVIHGLPLSHIPFSLLHKDALSVSAVFCGTTVSFSFHGQYTSPALALVILQLGNACSIISLIHWIFNASVIFT